MKKIVSLLLALTMVFALAACGQSAAPAPAATAAPAPAATEAPAPAAEPAKEPAAASAPVKNSWADAVQKAMQAIGQDK